MSERVRQPVVLLLSRSRRAGVMARRARELARRSAGRLDVRIAYRGEPTPPVRPDLVYVFDSAPRELRAALAYRARSIPVVLETGDLLADLRRATGVSRTRSAAFSALERASWRFADRLVVRGEGFRDVLRERGVCRHVDVLPEGVDLERFKPLVPGPGRARLGLSATDVVVGVVGSIVWSPTQEIAYGWELVEALPQAPNRVKAVVAGDGSGLGRLRKRATELGVDRRLVTPGLIPHDEVPALLGALDAVTWTQTPDALGRCRTTLKLPEYLACGRFVIASDVGEARRAVNGNGVRIAYRGGRDFTYVQGVASVLQDLAADTDSARRRGLTGVRVAGRYDWNRIAAGFFGIVERTLAEAAR